LNSGEYIVPKYRAFTFGLTKKTIALLIGMSLCTTITEMFGVGIFLPIFQFIRLQGDVNALVADSTVWPYIIDGLAWFGIEVSLAVLLTLSFVFFLGRQIFTYFRLIYHAAINQRLVRLLRIRMFNCYLEANTSFHDRLPVGNLVNAMTTEVSQAIIGVMAPLELAVYIIMALGYLLILSALSWEMTLVSIVVLLLASQVPNVWIRKSAHTGRKLAGSNSIMSSFLVGKLRSPRLVRLAGTEAAEQHEFQSLTQSQRKHAVFGSVLQSRTEVVIEPIIIGLSLVFLYFAYTVLQMQIEMIGLYLVVALRLMPIVKGVISQWQSVQRLTGSIEVVEDRLKEMCSEKEQDQGKNKFDKFQNIYFKHVTYRYPSAASNALYDISLRFESGKMHALVGPSGSGKSTLVDLLPRLRLPQSGEIEVDNFSIGNYSLSSIRKSIAYTPQSPQIFDGSVKNHIRYGKMDASDDEIEDAARLAGAEKFISQFPDQYETLLGEDAVRLSGGQRQRIDLARALVCKAPILILDEPTSNLDAESEEEFRQVLMRIRSETTTTIIIIAHRLASISGADQIVVLNEGNIEAVGRHENLIQQAGWYRRAWEMQEGKVKE
jgi:ABC-type multidrug transport system fused ATPase/permease subunit